MSRRNRPERPKRPAASRAAAEPAPPRAPSALASAIARVPAWLAIPVALAALLWACRGAPLGVAVADDYSFLARLAFQKPLDPFDSMGASFYWRPVSRQVYFSLVGPWLLDTPWAAAMFHAALIALLGCIVYRIARRDLSPAVSAAIAACLVLSEPARVLLGWPSGSQHLLASCFAALAVHEAMAGRIAVAGIAALAGVLSHEHAALAIPLLPLAVWRRDGARGPALRAAAVAAGVLVAWAIGYRIALAHGVVLPTSPGAATIPGATSAPLAPNATVATADPGALVARFPGLLARAVFAGMSAEDAGADGRPLVLLALVALLLAAFVIARRDVAARRRFRAALPMVAAGAAWFLAGLAPLAALLPDWNAWRAWTPTLGFGVATGAALGAISPWLAGGLATIKLAALLSSPVAPLRVAAESPRDGSHVSFRQLVRLQRIVSSARVELGDRVPDLPKGARVCYWELPLLSQFAFQGSRALRVWYADSSLVWESFGGAAGLTRHINALIEYRYDDPRVAAVIPAPAVAEFQHSAALMNEQRYVEMDSTLRAALALGGTDHGAFYSAVVRNMGFGAFGRGRYDEADSLRVLAEDRGPMSPDNWVLRAFIALGRNDRAGAENALRNALAIQPGHPQARELAQSIGMQL